RVEVGPEAGRERPGGDAHAAAHVARDGDVRAVGDVQAVGEDAEDVAGPDAVPADDLVEQLAEAVGVQAGGEIALGGQGAGQLDGRAERGPGDGQGELGGGGV